MEHNPTLGTLVGMWLRHSFEDFDILLVMLNLKLKMIEIFRFSFRWQCEVAIDK